MKSGTTSLHVYLDRHPCVSMTSEKEPNVFRSNDEFLTKKEWYSSLFKNKKNVCGECSPDYSKSFKYNGVPARIASVNPDAKIVYLLRDPIDRLKSHIWHNLICGREESLETILKDLSADNKYVKTGMYSHEIQKYLKYFDGAQIKLVLFEDLIDSPRTVVKDILEFVGLSYDDYPIDSFQKEHGSEGKLFYNKNIYRMRRFKRFFSRLPCIEKGVSSLVRVTFAKRHEISRPVLSSAHIEKLRNFYEEDFKILISRHSLSLNKWKSYTNLK